MKDDTISRAAALDALGERPVVWSDNDDYTLGERNQYDMDRLAIETVPSAQPVNIAKLQPNCNQVASDCISRQAVKHLDIFTKTYCRDKSVKDDYVFRCDQCDFQLPNGICLVKKMARKLCPEYRDFGSMGDL